MKNIFYTRRLRYLKVFTTLLLVVTACAPRLQKIDDAKLSGIPEDRLVGVNAAKKDLAMAKAELEKTRDAASEAEFRLRVARATLKVAEAKADQTREEFALAKFQDQSPAIVKAGESQRESDAAVQRAEADVKVAQAKRRVADIKISETESRVAWLEAKQEHERAKVALKYDDGTPSEKNVSLNGYEKESLSAELAWKGTDGKLQSALVELEQAEINRAALEKRP